MLQFSFEQEDLSLKKDPEVFKTFQWASKHKKGRFFKVEEARILYQV